jgi:integrase
LQSVILPLFATETLIEDTYVQFLVVRPEFWFLGPRRFYRHFRKAFDAACAAAGLQGIVPHDLRRSAVRNFIRAGVKESVAMRLSGHRTRSVFDRYNIVSEDDLIDASTKLQQFLVEAIKDEKVVPIQK